MSKTRFIEITKEDDPLLEQLKPLFELMYEQMAMQTADKKLLINLVPDGSRLWLEGIKRMLGRLGLIIVAVEDDKVFGFINGFVHFTPDYFGSLKIGTIAHLFVLPEKQGNGLGRELVKSMEQWFLSKKVHSIGLQVIFENLPALGFWKKCGYQEEIVQFRKLMDDEQ